MNTKELKEKYGRVFTASADYTDEETGEKRTITAYFRKPNRKELGYALTLQAKPLEMTEMIIKECFVGGDKEMITIDEYMFGCAGIVEKLLEVKNVELGEL